jgi:hypothetical protein
MYREDSVSHAYNKVLGRESLKLEILIIYCDNLVGKMCFSLDSKDVQVVAAIHINIFINPYLTDL